MSADDTSDHEPGGDAIVAAEYVLGVMPADERQAAARRIEAEPAFARLVEGWEGHFAPIAAAYAAVNVPASVKTAIDRRLFSGGRPASATQGAGLWSSLAFWRGLAVAAVAALLVWIALPLLTPPVSQPSPRMVASLAADGSDVHYLVIYDGGTGDVALSHVSGDRATGRDFELWMIEGQNAPVSMGIIPVGAATHVAVPPSVRDKIASGAVLAVSLEPAGGSPTGQPTGPVVAAGDLKSI